MIICSSTRCFTSYRFFVFQGRSIAAKNQFESYMTQPQNSTGNSNCYSPPKSIAGKASRAKKEGACSISEKDIVPMPNAMLYTVQKANELYWVFGW